MYADPTVVHGRCFADVNWVLFTLCLFTVDRLISQSERWFFLHACPSCINIKFCIVYPPSADLHPRLMRNCERFTVGSISCMVLVRSQNAYLKT